MAAGRGPTSTPQTNRYLGVVAIVAVVILALLGAALVAGAAGYALGLDPPWLARARHSVAEARYRAGGVLAEFGDWLRLGR